MGLNCMDCSHAILDIKLKQMSVQLGNKQVWVHCHQLQEMPFMQLVDSTTLNLLDLDEFELMAKSNNIEYMGIVHINEWGMTLSALNTVAITGIEIREGHGIMKQLLSEFGQVFGKPAAGLPPKHNIDHQIELKEGTQPIGHMPYQLNPEKLKELK
ncbi:hypothetical protein H4S07_000458 [Coemansia furcata]|uniref:Uncharacterized protein n=1 Tax=Coemansia furcata TaxID=417177 RepID=A0ACC1LS28_9FUNG|nr:hypothetical protein H4S07_000458 [Coemansia furcata]